ncbi:hypothetical protein [Clostridium uliginosum]|uniref:Uncharacterized protein n=1 Tax=Clostridium uliginosum TaxID=119641 RepID=A0A1I1QWW6_9CLOT|nr:hypothetical protein [Clostridium uliginosum]SFD23773.1 hypothetical protein SAMN05421842_12618 [Clostridium uliginosum]
MDINSVGSLMNTYSMGSLLNTMNNSDKSTNIPLIGSLDSYVQDYYSEMKLNGVSQNQELQNIFSTVQPSVNVPTSSNEFSNLQNSSDQNLIAQLGSGSSDIDNNILSAYTSIENGTYKPSSTSIMTTSPYTLYNNVNAMQNTIQATGNFLSTTY